MRVVPFPVRGSFSSATVVVRFPYQNWALCAWYHFRYWAMPFPALSFTGPRTGTGLYACGLISGIGLFCSGTVVVRVLYQNWILCAWYHFRYRATPFPARSFTGPIAGTGLYARGLISGLRYRALPVLVRSFLGSHTRTGLCQFRHGCF